MLWFGRLCSLTLYMQERGGREGADGGGQTGDIGNRRAKRRHRRKKERDVYVGR